MGKMDFESGLEALFEPRNVAVIGASGHTDKLGYTLAKNVLDYGFGGELFLINPKGGQAFGREILPSIREAGAVDLALISVPAANVPGVVEECGASGVRAAVVLSSGFAETGDSRLQSELSARAAGYGLRLLGPNCMGVYNLSFKFNGTYFWELPRRRGKISFVSQSGAMGGLFFQKVRERNLGVSKFVSVGNMVDITHAEVVSYLAGDRDTDVIGLFVEGIPEGRRFLAQVSRASRLKPVVLLKVGRTAAGQRAAQSHTGSLVGATEVLKAACEEIGVHWASNSEEFFDMLTALGSNATYPMRQNSLGIITISGGPGVLSSDLAEEQGINVPKLSGPTIERIKPLLVDFAAHSNPVDMTPQTSSLNYREVMAELAGDEQIGGLLAINVGLDRQEFARGLVAARNESQKPVLAYTLDTPQLDGILQENGIHNFPTLEGALRGFHALLNAHTLADTDEKQTFEPVEPGSEEAELWLKLCGKPQSNEFEVKQLLQAWGMPVVRERLVRTRGEIETAAQELGFPLVLKICRDEIIHKTEVGGVVLDIRNMSALLGAWERMEKKFPGGPFLLQEMAQAEVELILGGRRDPLFGPVVMVGLGGTGVELFRDIALGLAPLTEARARHMLQKLKSYPLLQDFRGRGPLAEEAVVEGLVRLSALMCEHGEIGELDLNPLLVGKDGVRAADAAMLIGM